MLAWGALAIDRSPFGAQLPTRVFAGGADAARDFLSVVAASMITVAGLGFSITIVALVLASTQFGPRLLTLFMRDRTSQLTLGMFAGTFVYCILILRSIRDPDDVGPEFVPQLALSIAIVLTVLSVAALVYFFHHVAVSIQAPKVVAAVARDLDHAIDRLYPVRVGQAGPPPDESMIPHPSSDHVIAAPASGYIQVVDDASLIDVAIRNDLTVRLMTRPGLFVVQGTALIVVRPAVDPGFAAVCATA